MAKNNRRKSVKLTKKQVLMVAATFKALVNVDTIARKVIKAVDEEEHVHHFEGRYTSWLHIQHADEFRTIIEFGITKYVDLFLADFSSEKYGNFLANWYRYVGSWAIDSLSSDDQKRTWSSLTSNHEISGDNRSCLIHSVFHELFTSLSNIMDAAQSRLFANEVDCTYTTSVAAATSIGDASDDNESLYRIAGFALHSLIKLRRFSLKAIKKTSKRNRTRLAVLAKEIQMLETLCCMNKQDIPEKLKLFDRGGLTFPSAELLPFLQHYAKEMKLILNHHALEDRGASTFRDAKNSASRNPQLFDEFCTIYRKLSGDKPVDLAIVKPVYKAFVRKLSNVLCKSFLTSRMMFENALDGKSNDAQLSLRTSLKQYASKMVTKIHL